MVSVESFIILIIIIDSKKFFIFRLHHGIMFSIIILSTEVAFDLTEKILTVAQAAKYLQVCDRTVRRLIESKTLTASKVGHAWRIRQGDIDRYLALNANNK